MPLFRSYFPIIDQQYELSKLQEVGIKFKNYGKENVGVLLAVPGENDMTAEGFYEPPEGGCIIKWSGHKYGMRAYISRAPLLDLTKTKRMIPLVGRFLSGTGEFKKKNIFQKGLIILSLFLWKEYFINWIWWSWRDNYLPEHKYNQPSRELHRIIKDEKIRDIICSILEYDCAYKYRAMDTLKELNKELFFKNPRKEVNRLFDILVARENDDGSPLSLSTRWKHIRLGLNVAMIFSRKLKKELRNMVWDLDIEAIKPTPEDIYWMTSAAYAGVKFMGMDEAQKKELHEHL